MAPWTCSLLTLLVASCGTDARTIVVDPMDPSAPRAVQEKQLTDSLRVRAADYGDGRAAVAIRDSAGQLLLGMEYTPHDDTHVLVISKVNLGALQHNDTGVVEHSYFLERSEADQFSLDDAVMGAAIIHGQYQNAAKDYDGTQDTSGCTIPILGTATSCSNKGACCDQHNKCYFAAHCDSLSWDTQGPASDECKQCNDIMVTCVNPFSPGPGPAACCGPDSKTNTCGRASELACDPGADDCEIAESDVDPLDPTRDEDDDFELSPDDEDTGSDDEPADDDTADDDTADDETDDDEAAGYETDDDETSVDEPDYDCGEDC